MVNPAANNPTFVADISLAAFEIIQHLIALNHFFQSPKHSFGKSN